MIKNLPILIFCFAGLSGLAQTSNQPPLNGMPGNVPVVFKASLDTQFSKGSGLQSITLTNEKTWELANLGMLWGLIKYHHPAVAAGNYNMDAELFRLLPKVLAAPTEYEAQKAMEQWVDAFGVPPHCDSCIIPENKSYVKMMPGYGFLFANTNFIKPFTDKLDTILKNRAWGGRQYYVEMDEKNRNPLFRHELQYAQNTYPDAGMRLLALFRFWNMVQYFYPYKYLVAGDWDPVLREFIPVFINAKDTLEYQEACLGLICRLNDTHANIWSAARLEEKKGGLMTPIQAKFIDEKLVVTGYYNDPDLFRDIIKTGDVIDRIDGFYVKDLIKKYLPLTSASNYETKLRDLPGPYGFLLRSRNTDVQLSLIENGSSKDVTLARLKWDERMSGAHNKLPGYKLLKNNIGYIFPGYLKENDLPGLKTKFANTKGLIIDMRCTPSFDMHESLCDWLKPAPSPFIEYVLGNTDIPGYFIIRDGPMTGEKNKHPYKGKLVIIVNEYTQSLAEYITMALATVPGAIILGSTTAGTIGEPSRIELPGGIVTAFSGYGVLYPNGRDVQRYGLKIDKVVRPTIQGIKEGKDELLDEAINLVLKKSK